MNLNKIKKQLRSESGQSVILISMVILSFIMFFSFAINTGVLITAKISVQSAADAAAYAGAATQARQLNAISFLNYDMRRQYKKFLYRYAFMGNIAASQFPNNPLGTTAGHYGYPKFVYMTNDPSSRVGVPIKVPVVCIPITATSEQSDNCNSLNLPSTTSQINDFFPGGGLTSITQQLLQSTSQIEAMQEQQCGKTSSANFFVLIEWLMRGDIAPSAIAGTLNQMMGTGMTADEKTKLTTIITNLVTGMGLYPRNLITLMRIESLEAFLNDTAKKDLTKETVDSLEQATDAEAHERTIQAFKSALSNLNNEVIKHDSVVMQELQNDRQISIEPIKVNFNAYVHYMKKDTTSIAGKTICNGQIIPFKAKKAPVGVKRVSGPPVHYAVKLTAKAKLLFLPIKDGIELEAFASAKPFGSRIGPFNSEETEFVENIKPTPVNGEEINDCSDSEVKCNVPNIKVSSTETYYSQPYLQSLASIGVVNQGTYKTYSFKGMPNGMAPQPYEVGKYNILPPPMDSTNMAFEFIPYASDQNSKIYRFYAPVFTGNADPVQKIATLMGEVFGTTAVPGTNPFAVDMMALKGVLQSELTSYVMGPLASGGSASEHGETTTFASIQLPMAQPLPPDDPITPHAQKYWLTTSSEVLSSWGPEFGKQSSGQSFKPRFGYSVKFVAMQNLLQSGMNQTDDDEAKLSH